MIMIERDPEIHLFYCAKSIPEEEAQSLQARFGNDGVKMLGLPCSGKMTIPYLLKALETGADGVILCTCPMADCHNLEGNLRASKRVESVDGLMEEVGLGKGRVRIVAKGPGEVERLIESIEDFRSELRAAITSSNSRSGLTVLRRLRASFDENDRRETAA